MTEGDCAPCDEVVGPPSNLMLFISMKMFLTGSVQMNLTTLSGVVISI